MVPLEVPQTVAHVTTDSFLLWGGTAQDGHTTMAGHLPSCTLEYIEVVSIFHYKCINYFSYWCKQIWNTKQLGLLFEGNSPSWQRRHSTCLKQLVILLQSGSRRQEVGGVMQRQSLSTVTHCLQGDSHLLKVPQPSKISPSAEKTV